MPVSARPLMVWCAAALLAAGCTQTVTGTRCGRRRASTMIRCHRSMSRRSCSTSRRCARSPGPARTSRSSRAWTARSPSTSSHSSKGAPPQCQWLFAETQTFGPDVEEFHKTTFQNPPDGGLISEAAAAYRDPATARRAFDGLVGLVEDCDSTTLGPMFVGDWTATADTLKTRPRRLRSRLPGEIGRAGRGHVLPISRLGARHRDDEHPREGAG